MAIVRHGIKLILSPQTAATTFTFPSELGFFNVHVFAHLHKMWPFLTQEKEVSSLSQKHFVT